LEALIDKALDIVFSEYGVLVGLSFIVIWVLWKRNEKLQDSFIDLAVKNTTVLSELTTQIKEYRRENR